MQTPDGQLHEINETTFKTMFDNQFKQDGTVNKYAPIVREGDVFRIRGCYFRVDKIGIDSAATDGVARNSIIATGITKEEYDKAKGM